MAKKKKKKNGNQDKTLQIIILVTSILNLIRVVIEIIEILLE